MTVTLMPYTERYRAQALAYLASFFELHQTLAPGSAEEEPPAWLKDTLAEWQAASRLYLITADGQAAGFLRFRLRGPQAAWIEDLYIDKPFRRRGIATAAIGAAEEEALKQPGCTALCMDVVPRNQAALALYHKLGYDRLSLVTVRKALREEKPAASLTLLGMKFRY